MYKILIVMISFCMFSHACASDLPLPLDSGHFKYDMDAVNKLCKEGDDIRGTVYPDDKSFFYFMVEEKDGYLKQVKEALSALRESEKILMGIVEGQCKEQRERQATFDEEPKALYEEELKSIRERCALLSDQIKYFRY